MSPTYPVACSWLAECAPNNMQLPSSLRALTPTSLIVVCSYKNSPYHRTLPQLYRWILVLLTHPTVHVCVCVCSFDILQSRALAVLLLLVFT